MTNIKSLNNSIAKAFNLLDYFNTTKPEWGVRELAKEIGANKSTTYRMLATMESLGVLRKDQGSEKYSLGLKLFELGNRVSIQSAFVSQTHPVLEQVAAEITETVHLGILKDSQVFMVDKIESPKGLKLNSVVGTSSPAYCSGLGKTLMAHLSDFDLSQTLKKIEFKANTEFTITKKTILKKELEEIRTLGYAIDRQELELGLICVAVPVFNQNDQVIAALSAAGPAIRFQEEKIKNYVAILQNGANAIKQRIGDFQL
ncbi:MAG: IclR family KDG regulon transcriptional repressor [Saprospiraceae bacterium]|jgi:IclR family KDG regulon transcriptional repressor